MPSAKEFTADNTTFCTAYCKHLQASVFRLLQKNNAEAFLWLIENRWTHPNIKSLECHIKISEDYIKHELLSIGWELTWDKPWAPTSLGDRPAHSSFGPGGHRDPHQAKCNTEPGLAIFCLHSGTFQPLSPFAFRAHRGMLSTA